MTGGEVLTRAAFEHYDEIVGEELERNKPRFATKTANSLTLLTAEAGEPLKYQWQLPSDCLCVVAPFYLGRVIDAEFFEIEGTVLRTRYNADVTLQYIWRPAEDRWTMRFRRIIEQRLEALFLRVTERFSAADARDKNTEFKAAVARHTDSAQRHGRPIAPGSIVQARLGARRYRA